LRVQMLKEISWPPVSVGLCVRNNEKTIANVLKSIFDSDYPHDEIEVIVVYGMCEDKTLDIIKRMSKTTQMSLKLFFDGGKGLARARQIVVENAQGKYIVWVDGDSAIPPNLIRNHVQLMESNSGIGVAYPHLLPKGKSVVARLEGYQWVLSSLVITDSVRRKGKLGIFGSVCRIEAIKEVGGFDASIKGAGEDVDLFIRIGAEGWDIVRNKETTVFHFMRDTWKSLWRESCWWGYSTPYLANKHKRYFPNFAQRVGLNLIYCVRVTIKSMMVTRDKVCLLMPVHFLFRRLGFLVGHMNAYKDIKKRALARNSLNK